MSLENPDNRDFASKDPNGFLALYDQKVIIDEVQLVAHLFSYIQTIVDDQMQIGQYVLSGSQNFQLLASIRQSLAGRVAMYKLFPFDAAELKSEDLLPTDYEILLLRGSYPAIYSRSMPSKLFYTNYITTYIEKDISDEFGINNTAVFRKLIQLCARHAGQQVNYSEFSKILGISVPTVRSWFSILESSYIIFLLHPYHNNFNKRLTKSPKLYFYDTGLVAHLLGIRHEEELVLHPSKGAIFENFIISEKIKLNAHFKQGSNFFYWKQSLGLEIDLLIENGLKNHAVEIKSTKTITSKLFTNLDKFERLSGNLISDKILIYGGNTSQNRTNYKVKAWYDIIS